MSHQPNTRTRLAKSYNKTKLQGDIQRKPWTQDEDVILTKGVEQLGSNWKEIARLLVGRNPSQCAQRWKRTKPVQLERNRKWTSQEDIQLLSLVGEHKCKWNLIAKYLPNRTGRQVRERYINHLDPQINKNGWTKCEDKLIWQLYLEHGTKWSNISKQLPGRPENMIKNRFYSHIRSKYGKVENPYYTIPNLEHSSQSQLNQKSQIRDQQNMTKEKEIQKINVKEEIIEDKLEKKLKNKEKVNQINRDYEQQQTYQNQDLQYWLNYDFQIRVRFLNDFIYQQQIEKDRNNNYSQQFEQFNEIIDNINKQTKELYQSFFHYIKGNVKISQFDSYNQKFH